MKKSLKTFVAVLATLLPLVLTGCNQSSSLDENARQAYENKKKIQALESSFEEEATEEEKAKYTEDQAEEMLSRLIYRELFSPRPLKEV